MAPACSCGVNSILWNKSTEGLKHWDFLYTERAMVHWKDLLVPAHKVTYQGIHKDKILPF